jgi:UDP-3-O-[3-hydroxymyristoyl] glucosamine N-acyltransferase
MKLKDLCKEICAKYEGDGDLEILNVCGLDNLSEGRIAFITNLASVPAVAGQNISSIDKNKIVDFDKVVIVQPENLQTPFKNKIFSDDPLVVHVKISSILNPPLKCSKKIDKSVYIGNDVTIGDDVTIDPKAVIYDCVTIGEGTIIRAGVVIMNNSTIGKNCILYPNVVVRDNCAIGNKVILHPNSVIGGDGHGYYQREGKNHKIPQVGRVILEDDVEIGSCSTVDRGRLQDTIVKKGTKIDNHVQVAHNVEIGEQSLISGHSAIGGSVKIGNNLIMGGFSAIADNRTIGNNVILSGGTGVAANLKDGSFMGGMPARPYREWQRSIAYLGNLGRLFKRLKNVEDKLDKTN